MPDLKFLGKGVHAKCTKEQDLYGDDVEAEKVYYKGLKSGEGLGVKAILLLS